MEILMAILVGTLYAAGIYMMMRRSLVKLIIGLALLGHASNLLIFSISRLVRGNPALIAEGATVPLLPFADPLPQALTLTAIVIGLGAQAFAIVLIRRVYQYAGTDDIDELQASEEH